MIMDKKKVEFFKTQLLEARNQILNSGVLSNLEDLRIEQVADEADLANNTVNQQISFSIREKEMIKLRRIDAALERVEEGVFGVCIESGEEIAEKRLKTQPWAEFCLEVAEEKEREDQHRFRRRA
jgi:DnaK suppressor protein